jgi:predicted alpha/beta-hydrolase family hydrolase
MDLLVTGPDAAPTLVLAHGAGSAMDSPWMDDMAARLAARGIRVVRFEFPYMAARRSGTRRPTPRADLSVPDYLAALDEVEALDATGHPLLIGGKSYGGRVASLVADPLTAEGRIDRLVCLGYPFHPPERPDAVRTAHLEHLQTRTLICQGTRDPLGSRDEVESYSLSPSIRVHWLEDGEHDLRPRAAVSGRTFKQNLEETADSIAEFTHGIEVG